MLAALIATSCGSSIDKEPTNSSPNNANNVSNTPNNVSNTENIANNDGSNQTNNVEPAACETRAECRTDQACVDARCADHWSCRADGGPNGSGCEMNWSCDDDKVYSLSCELFDEDFSMASCVCAVNDVVIAEFTGETEPICDTDTSHRAVNENCGWLVPSYHSSP